MAYSTVALYAGIHRRRTRIWQSAAYSCDSFYSWFHFFHEFEITNNPCQVGRVGQVGRIEHTALRMRSSTIDGEHIAELICREGFREEGVELVFVTLWLIFRAGHSHEQRNMAIGRAG